MSANIAAARRLLTEATPIDRWEEMQEPFSVGDLIAFCPRDFLRRIEPELPGLHLPHSWDATSDSIAARVAQVLAATEVILLKSAPQPAQATTPWSSFAEFGYIDRCFPQFSGMSSGIRLVCLHAT